VPESLWVAALIISDPVRVKLSAEHSLDADDVRREVVAVQGLRYRWRDDPPRGRRAYVEIFVGDDRVLVALYPVDHPMGDVYALGSAYREPRGLDTV
jgi:hypothetical protein